MQLIRYEAARFALAECHRIDEVKDIRDKAQAMAAYARQAKDTELIQYATEIKVKAERRCGELLSGMDRAAVGDNQFSRSSDAATTSPTLADMGLTKDQSSRFQKLAAMPLDVFEAAVETAKEAVGEVTTAFMLREARTLQPQRERPPAPTILGMRPDELELQALRLMLAELQVLTGKHDAPDIIDFVRGLMA